MVATTIGIMGLAAIENPWVEFGLYLVITGYGLGDFCIAFYRNSLNRESALLGIAGFILMLKTKERFVEVKKEKTS
jgi:hypothetical protein